ncbi:DUF1289 domain-containing protein [Methylocystis sp. JAN1]|uniref:DUF1289 domain-containing protein n=1 Tax=Methylocystis sp. JAN1 TaxID=3397211 RepID=UPI003FA244AC
MIPSPCNKICTLNSNNVCVGCGRSREEIGAWSQLSEDDKKRVAERAKARLLAIAGLTPAKVKA